MMNKGELPIFLSRNWIMRAKARALRAGVWYRVLSRIERACIDLVINVVERVRSRLLTGVLSSVLDKLEEAMGSRVRRLMRDVGSKLASDLSRIAQEWGHRAAKDWLEEAGFVQYLTINYMNASR